MIGRINYFPTISVKRHKAPEQLIQHILLNAHHVMCAVLEVDVKDQMKETKVCTGL